MNVVVGRSRRLGGTGIGLEMGAIPSIIRIVIDPFPAAVLSGLRAGIPKD